MTRSLPQLALVVCSVAALAQPIEAAELRVLRTPESGITVGDPVQLILEMALAPEETVTVPDWTTGWLPEEASEIELVAVGKPIVEAGDRNSVWRQILTLRSFRPGAVEVPAPGVAVDRADGSSVAVSAGRPVSWTVESVLPTAGGEVELQPARAVRPRPLGRGFWILASACLLTCVATAYAGHRLHAFTAEGAARGRRDPLAELRQALQALDPRNPIRGHVGLSTSLRRFLERRAGTPALERTTSEIFRDLTQMPVDDTSRLQVREILEDCDRVKFGGFPTSRDELTERVRHTQRVAETLEAGFVAAETIESAAGEEAAA